MKNVLIVGAHGQIGQFVVQKLQDQEDFSPIAMVRKEDQLKEFKENKVEAVMGNLEDSVDDLAKVFKGSDAVVFTAGSGGSTGPEKTVAIDLDGAIKSIDAAEKAGVKRFVMVSAMLTDDRDQWPEEMKTYYIAKYYADRALKNSKLDYTIIRPGMLENEAPKGKVSVGDKPKAKSVPREDVAEVIVEVLAQNNTIHKTFDLVSGEEEVKEAIKNI
ncbi:putative sugar epimerase YhfK [Echinicola pacifica]|uniref:Sugar epimerase YhfK n=1 Tax=Echinicola pacifica TaxID=346377 RepID=A0A918Q1F0_9BACT|nr:SDR family oxidoreductase [Echinicola pacifica]GGZ30508.1 putative sugar epimerase YhfK [Echinicola pacifica]